MRPQDTNAAFAAGQETNACKVFSVPGARDILHDLFEHNPAIYWTDLLVSVSVAYIAGLVYLFSPLGPWPQIACFFVTAMALYRLGTFMHEIAHMSGKQMRGFRLAYNLLAGVMFLMPYHLYDNHIDHHSPRNYGTGRDGEYLPLAGGSLRYIAAFLAQIVLIPLYVLLRFSIITPVSFLHPLLRQFVLQRISWLAFNSQYRREIPGTAPRAAWAMWEIACFLRILAVIPFLLAGLVTWPQLGLIYLLAMFAIGLNHVHNLAAHHYRSDGRPMSHTDQLLDSVNITGGPILTELLFPLGLRFHALHHLFPTVPYHNLGVAHRRLMRQLPPNSPYHATVYPNFWSVLKELLQDSIRAGKHKPTPAQVWYKRRGELMAAFPWSKSSGRKEE